MSGYRIGSLIILLSILLLFSGCPDQFSYKTRSGNQYVLDPIY
ncbi:hypothetical Protein YC6258_03983 [Gynuella sunshinyii YC6258]|uniref:Uncharacterized protein n=1 Tax=Gynuella sunshinyii YC6258 TaxID=1445510 RepID=A0A0C5W012_9GAMM|nr:hypothetical Protein YC6258_03983 [Gynuella sunshinyii YC6258]